MSLQSVVACRSVKDFSDPVLDLIERTYTESFPEVERRDFSLVRNLVRDESRFIVYALSKESRYVGFITGCFLTVILRWSILQLIRRPVMEE